VKRSPARIATLKLRALADIKELLVEAAKGDCCSLANMLEVIVVEYCDRNGIRLVPGPKTSGAA